MDDNIPKEKDIIACHTCKYYKVSSNCYPCNICLGKSKWEEGDE